MKNLRQAITTFSGEQSPKMCRHKHRMEKTGGVFYRSVGLLQCSRCLGWQAIRKGIK